MYSLKGLALRLFRANKFIVFSSILSIAIATTLVITMVLYSMGAKDTLETDLKTLYGDMDLSVGYDPNQEKIISDEFVQQLQSHKDVKHLSKVSITNLNLNQLGAEIYTIGLENDSLAKSRYHFSIPLDEKTAIINRGLADALQLKVGDEIVIENRPFTLVEVINNFSASANSPDILILSNETVKRYIRQIADLDSEATYLLVKANKETNLFSLADDFKMLDRELRIEITEQDSFIKDNLKSLSVFIIILSVLVLLVTSLLIISNFELLLYKMKNQFAIMRSLGATTKQMSELIFIQSTIINLIGALLGFFSAFITQKLLFGWMESWFSLPPSTVGFHFFTAFIIATCCFGVIQLFLLLPTYRSAQILPLKVMEQNEKLDFGYSKARLITFKVLFCIILFLIISSQVIPANGGNGVFLILVAALLMLVALFLVFPIYLTKLFEWILTWGQKLLGRESYVAIKNIIPQVKKNTVVILTICSLMIIAVFGSVMLKTIHEGSGEYLKSQFPTRIVVESRLGYETKVNPVELSEKVEMIPTVEQTYTVSTFGLGNLKVGDTFESFDFRLVDLKRFQEQKLFPRLMNQTFSQTVVISTKLAKKHQLKQGDNIELGLYSNLKQAVESKGSYTIGALSNQLLGDTEMYMDWSNQSFNDESTIFEQLFVDASNVTETVNQLENLKIQYPELKINSYEVVLKESAEMFYQRWAIFIMVLVVLVFSTTVGVFNSLANTIYSKRKEFAILRTMGIKPAGIQKIILTQVTLFIIIGLAMGTFVGVLLTLILSLVDPGPLFIDYKVILIIVVSMLLMGVILFTFLGGRIGQQNITIELSNDNK